MIKRLILLVTLTICSLSCGKNDDQDNTKEARLKVVLSGGCSLRFIGDESNTLVKVVNISNASTVCTEFQFNKETLDFYATSNNNYGSDGFTYFKGNIKDAYNFESTPELVQYPVEQVKVTLPNFRIRQVVVTKDGVINVLYEGREGDSRSSIVYLSKIVNSTVQSTVNLTEIARIGPGAFDNPNATFLNGQDKILFVEYTSHLHPAQTKILDLNTLEFSVNIMNERFNADNITSIFYSADAYFFIVLKEIGSFNTVKELYDHEGKLIAELTEDFGTPNIIYDDLTKEFDYLSSIGKIGTINVETGEVKRTGTVEPIPGRIVEQYFYNID